MSNEQSESFLVLSENGKKKKKRRRFEPLSAAGLSVKVLKFISSFPGHVFSASMLQYFFLLFFFDCFSHECNYCAQGKREQCENGPWMTWKHK